MSRPVRNLTLALWILAVAGMIWVVANQLWLRNPPSARSDAATIFSTLPDGGATRVEGITAPAFALTDQLGHAVTADDLKGHPWIADFIFTQCASECPLMTKHLADLQGKIPADVKFVSFSVDPEHDTPSVLSAYATQFGADGSRWRFLTGDKKAVMDAVAGMKSTVIPATKDSPIEHDIHYILMDAANRMYAIYDSRVAGQIDQLVNDANGLSKASQP